MSRPNARHAARTPTRRSPRRLPALTLAASIRLAGLAGLAAAAGSAATTPLMAQHAAQTAPQSPIPDPATVTPEAWQKDLTFLADRISEQHPNPWHQVTRQEFEAAVSRLQGRIPELGYPQTLVGLMQIVALLGPGDGHSRVRLEPPFIGALYPLRLWWFSDGLYVRS
ncbi:MAG: hypothetical protein V3W32_09205, partial [Gemmatimonadota bacterium]